MDAAAERELRELRARAYGRDADIAMDAAAVRRLHELESARSAAVSSPARESSAASESAPARAARAAPGQTRGSAVVAGSVPATTDDADVLRAIERAVNDEADPTDAEAEAAAARRTEQAARRRATWWAASVVGAAAVAAVVTFTLSSTPAVSASSGAPQVETLRLTDASDRIPEGWFGADDDTLGADFFGFTVFSYPGWTEPRDPDDERDRCIAVVKTAEIPPVDGFDQNDWTYGGDFYSGCGIGVFPATVQVPVGSGTPEELTARYPSAEALQFVLDGDRVGVFLDSGLG
ncbi:hypothetical protein HWD99_10095 [Microbacterium sp. C5A9]|uniref:hypothetical protein n=1 Tax=Microbacterium sp. C5A9 TaxID=2736663 RepID=UPI001F520326|nr:hypothetical protein [Microbacterium sp. C5A9]MCI1018976.1 hypothetical protein [Microbacterium sp. C5A9]